MVDQYVMVAIGSEWGVRVNGIDSGLRWACERGAFRFAAGLPELANHRPRCVLPSASEPVQAPTAA
jgi:hypothetical protein